MMECSDMWNRDLDGKLTNKSTKKLNPEWTWTRSGLPSKGGSVNKRSKRNNKIQHNLSKVIIILEAIGYTIGTPDKLNSKANIGCNQLYNSIIDS